ncbi:MAG TPA: hypothetical protein VG895_02115 [Patescibacteria group bacterium]|nr:hypothetical protein [Patescibacteria group bacterium]
MSAFEHYKKEFIKHDNLSQEYLSKAYFSKNTFTRAALLIWTDRETVESIKALIMANEASGTTENNKYWQGKINKIFSKYPTQKEVLFYES